MAHRVQDRGMSSFGRQSLTVPDNSWHLKPRFEKTEELRVINVHIPAPAG